MGHLKLQLANVSDNLGELFAEFEAHGFAGHGSAWFSLTELSETARQFALYPLPSNPPICMAGGIWDRETATAIKEEHLYIAAYPTNSRGNIGIRIRAAYEVIEHRENPPVNHCAIELRVSYEQMKQFSADLLALLEERLTEVLLEEQNS